MRQHDGSVVVKFWSEFCARIEIEIFAGRLIHLPDLVVVGAVSDSAGKGRERPGFPKWSATAFQAELFVPVRPRNGHVQPFYNPTHI